MISSLKVEIEGRVNMIIGSYDIESSKEILKKSIIEILNTPIGDAFEKRGYSTVIYKESVDDNIHLRFRSNGFTENYTNIFFIDGYVYYFTVRPTFIADISVSMNIESLKDSTDRTFLGTNFSTFTQRLDKFTPYSTDDIFDKIAEIKEITKTDSVIVEYEENILK